MVIGTNIERLHYGVRAHFISSSWSKGHSHSLLPTISNKLSPITRIQTSSTALLLTVSDILLLDYSTVQLQTLL